MNFKNQRMTVGVGVDAPLEHWFHLYMLGIKAPAVSANSKEQSKVVIFKERLSKFSTKVIHFLISQIDIVKVRT